MSIRSIRAALESAVNSMLPALPTAWQNDSFTPTKGVAWQRVSFLMARPNNESLDDSFKEKGIMSISLFYPLRIGSALAAERVDLIREIFKRNTVFTKDGFNVVVSETPEISSERKEVDWFSMVVDIRFYACVTV